MESQALLGGGAPILVSSERILGRRHWKVRFAVLSLFGVFVTYHVFLLALSWKHGFGVQYVLYGSSPLRMNTTMAQAELDKVLSESNLARNWSYQYTHEQHLLGKNQQLVDWTKQKFHEFGLSDTNVETYHVYLNKPKDHALKLLDKMGKVAYSAPLTEDALKEDLTTQNDTVPTFHGYSASGNVTSSYFYANYGRKQDFQALRKLGMDMKGKIAIVRYGEIYRGLKVKFAQESGASGVVMYSDPGDDGKFIPQNGYKAYPEGPARNPSSVQRGSVMYLSYLPGDPTTPGYASTKNAPRADPYGSIPKIPSLPISYRDVLPILSELNGLGTKASDLGSDWVGKLEGFDYNIGLSPENNVSSPQLNLFNDQEYSIVPIQNVFGTTKGVVEDEVVIVGGHRDAWIRGGAGDPNSGLATMLEIARAFQAASCKGFKPYRTILWASWDGEEPGLLGLTEWAEDHAAKIKKKVVAYLNIDSAVTGNSLTLQSSPLLKNVLLDIAKTVEYPKGGSLYDHFLKGPHKGKVGILGSGSDYTVFLEHLGIPSFDIGFSSNPQVDPVYQYHLNYDLFHWMDTIADPGFLYHNTMAKFFGKVIMAICGPELIPFGVHDYGVDIESYFEDALKSVPEDWYRFKEQNFKEKHTFHPLPEKFLSNQLGKIEYIKDFKEAVRLTKKSIALFKKTGERVDATRKNLQENLYVKKSPWRRFRDRSRVKLTNLKLVYLDRIFLYEKGLKDRPWFKHAIYASGRYTGYAGQSLPGFREAVEDKDPASALLWLNVYMRSLLIESGILTIDVQL